MKSQFLFFIIAFAIFTGFTNALTLRSEHSISHDLESLIATRFTHRLSHYAEIPKTIQTALSEFVKNDKQILQSVKDNKPLSEASAVKVRDFLLQNKEFQDFSIKVLTAKATKPDCMANVKGDLKNKTLKLILQEWDFKVLFLEKKEELNDPQTTEIIKKLEKQKDIKAELDRCFAKYE